MLSHVKSIIENLKNCCGKQWIHETECEIILNYLYKTKMKHDVLEIGTWNGITAVGMGCIAKYLDTGKKIYSIDNYVGHPNLDVTPIIALNNYYINIIAFGVYDYCSLIISNSEEVSFTKSIGLLFIDGGHSYEQVKKDITKYAPNVVDGGIIICHDYSDAFPDTMRAIDESGLNGHKEGGSLYVAVSN